MTRSLECSIRHRPTLRTFFSPNSFTVAGEGHGRMWSSPLMWATSKTRDSTLRNCPPTLPPFKERDYSSQFGFTLDLDRRSGRARHPAGRRHYRPQDPSFRRSQSYRARRSQHHRRLCAPRLLRPRLGTPSRAEPVRERKWLTIGTSSIHT